VRALLLAVAILFTGGASAARAEPPSPPGIGFADKRPPAGPRWGDGKTDGTEPTAEPARGSSYNYIQMVYASVIMLAMLAFTIWLIRRHTRNR
jgi:hypothetical protein